MGEETDIAEPMSSDDVKAAEDIDADEPSKDSHRKRNRHLHKSLCELMEFYLGNVNLSKDRFISQKIQGKPFVYIDLSMFLTFNKVKVLTSRVEDLAKALACSEILQVSEDGTQVCRKTPIMRKENEDDCTIYVERLGPDVDHNLLTKVFSQFGTVDYISMPRFAHSGKFKGFAFVEFRDPECAKKALEALNAKGCCLSPHMAPEELMSIKNFEPSQENKKEDVVKDTETKENNPEKTEADCQEHSEIKGENTETVCKKDIFRKEKRKRKHSEGNEKVDHKKLKYHHSEEADEVKSENDKDCKMESMSESKESKEKETSELNKSESNSVDDVTNKKNKGKKKDKTTEQPAVDEEKNKDATKEEEKAHRNKRKRKHSSNDAGVDETNNKEEIEPAKKKPKSDTDEGTETEVSQAEGEEGTLRKKKKRKKQKKVKKEKSTASALGLKVLSKKEWKQLRNRYLNMQRDMMRSLKQHLSYSKWEKNKPTPPEPEEKVTKQEDFIKPGTVIRVVLDEPVTNPKAAKSEMRVHPDIRYTDVTEGSTSVYLRAATAELAAALVQARHWPNMEVLQACTFGETQTGYQSCIDCTMIHRAPWERDEEAEYWKKIKMDREEHCKKNKYNQRGRAKLLKRAERYQSKHITTFET